MSHKVFSNLYSFIGLHLLVCIISPLILEAAGADSLLLLKSDSSKVFMWQPRYLPLFLSNESGLFSTTFSLELEAPNSNMKVRYYDPRNVVPKNFWELDYRYHSYYTPKIVSDFLDQAMNRPRADSFVPIPTLALIAASLALRHLDIQQRIRIEATDYLVGDKDLPILEALWEKSPQTATELFEITEINQNRRLVLLLNDLQHLVDRKIIRTKKMETEEDQYFAAQSENEVILLLKSAIDFKPLSTQEMKQLNELLLKLEE